MIALGRRGGGVGGGIGGGLGDGEGGDGVGWGLARQGMGGRDYEKRVPMRGVWPSERTILEFCLSIS